MDLPPPYDIVKQKLIAAIQSGEIDNFYGLDGSSDVLRMYHATVDSKLKGIADKGLMAFKELDHQEPRVFITASPTLALYHAIHNGPHDTLRKEGKLDADAASGEPVLLMLQVDKAWLANNPDAQKPLAIQQWLKEAKGIKPENDSRFQAFKDGLRSEINELKQGRETSDFGISFPTDKVPPKFIFVQPLQGVVIHTPQI